MPSELSCGVDIGGTKILAGLLDASGTIVDEIRVDSPADDAAAITDAVVSAVGTLRSRHVFDRVGLGAAGWIDRAGETVMFAPNVAWRDEPLAAELGKRLGMYVRLENDANTAAWGEHRYGAGRGSRDFLLVAVGTGIGGGIVFDGALYRGGFGVAGEIGHTRFVPDGVLCGCGNRGCWEQYASGVALNRRAQAAGLPWIGHDITAAAFAGEPAAIAMLAEVGRDLGTGIAQLVAVLDPEVVCIGGGLIDAGDLFIGPAREAFEAELTGRGHRPVATVVPAVLGNRAGWIGAADLARAATV